MKTISKIAVGIVVILAPTIATAKSLTVLAVSHSRSENHYTVTRTADTNTNCAINGNNSMSCNSTTSGGGTENHVTYHFIEIVLANEDGKAMQYTLSRTARWIWSSMDELPDGEIFPAEIKGKNMLITYRRGGNQGKLAKLKYEIMDIRPATKHN